MSKGHGDKLTAEQLDQIKSLEAMPDAAIDTTDIPETTDEEFGSAIRRAEFERKIPVSIRLDPDVLGWFRRSGEGYQSRINKALREHIERHDHETAE